MKDFNNSLSEFFKRKKNTPIKKEPKIFAINVGRGNDRLEI